MTVAAVAVEFFTGSHQKSLDFLTSHYYIKPFSKSRFNRRLHQIPEALWQFSLSLLAQIHKKTKTFLVDTFPCAKQSFDTCSRLSKYPNSAMQNLSGGGVPWLCRLFAPQKDRASKKEYFYGLKVCLIVSESGRAVELVFAPGSTADIEMLHCMPLELPEQSALSRKFLTTGLGTKAFWIVDGKGI